MKVDQLLNYADTTLEMKVGLFSMKENKKALVLPKSETEAFTLYPLKQEFDTVRDQLSNSSSYLPSPPCSPFSFTSSSTLPNLVCSLSTRGTFIPHITHGRLDESFIDWFNFKVKSRMKEARLKKFLKKLSFTKCSFRSVFLKESRLTVFKKARVLRKKKSEVSHFSGKEEQRKQPFFLHLLNDLPTSLSTVSNKSRGNINPCQVFRPTVSSSKSAALKFKMHPSSHYPNSFSSSSSSASSLSSSSSCSSSSSSYLSTPLSSSPPKPLEPDPSKTSTISYPFPLSFSSNITPLLPSTNSLTTYPFVSFMNYSFLSMDFSPSCSLPSTRSFTSSLHSNPSSSSTSLTSTTLSSPSSCSCIPSPRSMTSSLPTSGTPSPSIAQLTTTTSSSFSSSSYSTSSSRLSLSTLSSPSLQPSSIPTTSSLSLFPYTSSNSPSITTSSRTSFSSSPAQPPSPPLPPAPSLPPLLSSSSCSNFSSSSSSNSNSNSNLTLTHPSFPPPPPVLSTPSLPSFSSNSFSLSSSSSISIASTSSSSLPPGMLLNPSATQKPFACAHCGRSFWRKFDCKRHMRTHTFEKPFECDHCDRSFARKDALNRHLQANAQCRTAGKKLHVCSSFTGLMQ